MITIPIWWLYVLCAMAGAGTIAALAVLWAACYAMATYLNDRHAAAKPRPETTTPPHWTPR